MTHCRITTPGFLSRLTLAIAGLAVVQASGAADFELGSAKLSLRGTLSFGQKTRDSERNPELLNGLNAAAIGSKGTASGGRNQDDGELNFANGDPVSTVLKAYAEGQLTQGSFSAFVSAKAWHDYTLADKALPWGNIANGLRSDIPLSDAGFGRRSRFSGATLQSAYVQAETELAQAQWRGRLGAQLIGWGNPWLLGGGLQGMDTNDLQASRRPGALSAESNVPTPALRLSGSWASGLSVDGFVMFKFEPTPSTVCGTFYSVADYIDGACDKAILGATANDRGNLAAGSYLARSAVVLPPDGGQFGLSAAYRTPDRRWSAGVYAANIHSRTLVYNMIKTLRATGQPAVPNDPGKLNPSYEIEYPADVHVLGVDGRLNAWGGSFSAELTHVPNQPVPLNSGDLVGAFASLASVPGILRADERATPLGGRYHGWDRLRVSDLRLGFAREFRGVGGAQSLGLRAELVGKFVHDLPDVSQRRYRRPDVFGNGPVAGSCTGSAKQCSTDGFVTSSALALRTRFSASFASADGLQFTPSLSFGQDLKGWAYDNTMGEGRRLIGLSARLSQGRVYAEFTLSHSYGNPYDNTADRDTAGIVLGLSF